MQPLPRVYCQGLPLFQRRQQWDHFWLCDVSLHCAKSDLELKIDLGVDDESPSSGAPPVLDTSAENVPGASPIDNYNNLSSVSATSLTFGNPLLTSVRRNFPKVMTMVASV